MLLPYPASGQETAATSLDTSPHIQRGIAAMRGQQWNSARSAWESVLRLEPENAAALSNLGKVQYQLAEYEAARGSLEKATTLKPDLADSWLTLGQVYLELKAPMMAVSATTRGVAENPSDPRAHNSLAIILKRIGWTNGAEVELQKALDLDPDFTEAHFNLAVMYLERKPPSLEMAGRHYRKARALGAAPDEIVEQQIRGESAVEESEVSKDESPEAPAGGAFRKETAPAKPPRATLVDPPAAPPRQPSVKKTPPPRKSTPP